MKSKCNFWLRNSIENRKLWMQQTRLHCDLVVNDVRIIKKGPKHTYKNTMQTKIKVFQDNFQNTEISPLAKIHVFPIQVIIPPNDRSSIAKLITAKRFNVSCKKLEQGGIGKFRLQIIVVVNTRKPFETLLPTRSHYYWTH